MRGRLAIGHPMDRKRRVNEYQQRIGAIFHGIHQFDLMILDMRVFDLMTRNMGVLELRFTPPEADLESPADRIVFGGTHVKKPGEQLLRIIHMTFPHALGFPD